jgi:competence protein ComEC
MRRAGLTHILVLSGFNVTIVGLFLVTIFSFAPIPIRAGVAIFGIALLVAASGGDPPALRAGITGTLALCALVFGRERSVFHLLVLTLLGMLLVNPLLITNISFQLSALATIGVITMTEPIQRLLPRLPFADVLASTLAALLSVLPLSIVSFHSLSLIAPLANLVVLPLVPLSMLFGMIGALLAPWVGALGVIIAYVPLHLVYVLGTWFGSLPFASIAVSLTPLVLLVYAPLVFMLAKHIEKKNTTE